MRDQPGDHADEHNHQTANHSSAILSESERTRLHPPAPRLDARRDYNHDVSIIVLGEFEYLLLSAAARLGDLRVLASLSGRAVWLTGSILYFVVLNSTWARFVLSDNIILPNESPLRLLIVATLPLGIPTLLFSFAALSGVFLGLRRRALP